MPFVLLGCLLAAIAAWANVGGIGQDDKGNPLIMSRALLLPALAQKWRVKAPLTGDGGAIRLGEMNGIGLGQ